MSISKPAKFISEEDDDEVATLGSGVGVGVFDIEVVEVTEEVDDDRLVDDWVSEAVEEVVLTTGSGEGDGVGVAVA